MEWSTPKPLNDDLRELFYLLLVKSSNWRVLPGMSGKPSPEGELQISTMLASPLTEEKLYWYADNESYTKYLKGIKSRDYDESIKKHFLRVCKKRDCYPQDYDFIDAFIQADFYCRKEELTAFAEASSTRSRFKEIYKENQLFLDKYKLFLINLSDVRDYAIYSNDAPSGFVRSIFELYVIVGIKKD